MPEVADVIETGLKRIDDDLRHKKLSSKDVLELVFALDRLNELKSSI
jgi:hypothetical protein